MNENDEPQNQGELMELIHRERAALEETLSRLDEQQLLLPLGTDGWTVKDLLAHITIWEQRMVQWMQESLQGITPERPAPGMTWDDLDRLNLINFQESKDLPLETVLGDFNRSHDQVLKLVGELTQEELFDPQHFAWRNGDPMWHMVAANTWWHYREHNETIRSWMMTDELH
jgi:hypothetical protein